MKPGGGYVMLDLDKIGGIPLLLKKLSDKGLLHQNVITATGKTLKENLSAISLPSNTSQLKLIWVNP